MKSNQKSVRMTDDVLNYVEKFPGEGFNQKFEGLVRFVAVNEKDIADRVKELEERERDLILSISRLRAIESNLSGIKRYLAEASKLCRNAPLPGQIKIG